MSNQESLPAPGGETSFPRRKHPRIAVTLGDPNGVGPEVVLKCLSDSRLLKFMEPVVIGSAHVFQVHANKLGYRDLRIHVVQQPPEHLQDGGITVLDVAGGEKPEVRFGEVTREAGALAMKAVEVATDLCLQGDAAAMVTAPISKEAIALAGYDAPGHTEFIARRAGSEAHTMMLVSDELRVGLVTGHIPIWDVPKSVTCETILEKIRVIGASLAQDFGIDRPKIAVLGLNPHAGDGGVLGREEVDAIVPAINQACEEGILVFGPFPADSFFGIGAYRLYDAVLAMYHDQGLIPFKTLAFESGINYTAGLSIVRTSPDHGTAFNIAGEGKASPGSMRSALYLAIDIARRRARPVGQRKAG
jgi:4-hydroxythreonine-4-phosphate dehydrogenase